MSQSVIPIIGGFLAAGKTEQSSTKSWCYVASVSNWEHALFADVMYSCPPSSWPSCLDSNPGRWRTRRWTRCTSCTLSRSSKAWLRTRLRTSRPRESASGPWPARPAWSSTAWTRWRRLELLQPLRPEPSTTRDFGRAFRALFGGTVGSCKTKLTNAYLL